METPKGGCHEKVPAHRIILQQEKQLWQQTPGHYFKRDHATLIIVQATARHHRHLADTGPTKGTAHPQVFTIGGVFYIYIAREESVTSYLCGHRLLSLLVCFANCGD